MMKTLLNSLELDVHFYIELELEVHFYIELELDVLLPCTGFMYIFHFYTR